MSTLETRELKREIRKVNKQKRAEMPKDIKAEKDSKICDNIINSMSFKYADVLLMFCPTDEEIDILPLFEAAKKEGKRVAFPKCYAKGIMKFFAINSFKSSSEAPITL